MSTLEQKASLEFAYIDALSKPWSRREGYGIPSLEKYVEAHPESRLGERTSVFASLRGISTVDGHGKDIRACGAPRGHGSRCPEAAELGTGASSFVVVFY